MRSVYLGAQWRWEKCAEQQRTGDRTPIVLLFAGGRHDEQALALFAAAIIPEPFDIDRVTSTIQQVC